MHLPPTESYVILLYHEIFFMQVFCTKNISSFLYTYFSIPQKRRLPLIKSPKRAPYLPHIPYQIKMNQNCKYHHCKYDTSQRKHHLFRKPIRKTLFGVITASISLFREPHTILLPKLIPSTLPPLPIELFFCFS